MFPILNGMNDTHTTPSIPLKEIPITSIQPGGGFVMSLELLWSRIRRALLRTFRPGYVKRMLDKRQGRCTGKHDIIDSRDLKFYRNVCGYWFRPEDDRFQWRDRIPLARAGLGELVFFSLILVLFLTGSIILAINIHSLFWISTGVVSLLWLFVISFFRDPARTIPEDPDALVSPADGTVTHIDEVEEPDFPGGRAFRISIFLSVFNVHVNRMPRSGRVIGIRYFPGRFLDARSQGCHKENEQLWIDLAEDQFGRWMRIKQISGAVARRIVCWLKPGEVVQRGQRPGMIKFGSRTEVYLPIDIPREVLVQVGDSVKGGSTILLRYKANEETHVS